jgi:two-component system, chemotaxis family, sensor kinase CheA
MGTREERRAALIRKFKDIGAERVERLNLNWVRLEQTPDDLELAAELLRELHTLKGEAKTVGFADIALVSHKLESLVFRARDAGWRVPAAVSEVVLKTVDAIEGLLKRSVDDPPVDLERVLSTVDVAVAALGAPQAADSAPEPRPSPQVSSPGTSPAEETQPANGAGRGRDESLRVRVARIASISNVTGELQVEQSKVAFGIARVISAAGELEARLQRLEVTTRDSDEAKALTELAKGLRREAAALDENSYRTGLHVQELDRTVRELRLVPVSTLLDLFARMVRDLAAEQGREAVLHIEGGEVEADKRILETLEEPLLHLLRNAVDHGIEAPETRVALGKPRQGRISVQVRHLSGAMTMVLSDDGKGLDPDRLKQKVVEKGLVTAAQAAALDDQGARELVFLPGFSTLDRATHVSGRGVGMDVVKRRVEQLSGRLKLTSVKGAGMTVEMTVPITISMTRCLIIDVGRLKVALPSASIDGIHQVQEAKVLATLDGPALRVGDQVLPLAPLDSLLGATAGQGGGQQGNVAVVLRSGAERIAVRVATPGREASLVVKPLGPPLTDFKLVTGAAVLESGQLVLMVDVAELVARRRERKASLVEGEAKRDVRAAKVLVVDDSIIFQSTVSAIVQGLGHDVQVAGDGVEGIAALESFAADLIITDIQMPRMDGLQFLRALRADARFQALPVVVLSSLGSTDDREKAAHAGATAYLVKSQLDEQAVSEVLRRLL